MFHMDSRGIISSVVEVSDKEQVMSWLENNDGFKYLEADDKPIYSFKKIGKNPDLWNIRLLLGHDILLFGHVTNEQAYLFLSNIKELRAEAYEYIIYKTAKDLLSIRGEVQ